MFCQALVRPRFHYKFSFSRLEGSGPVAVQMSAKSLIRGHENTSYKEILKNLDFVD